MREARIVSTNNKARIPKQKRGIESKEKIIKAATKLFTEKGYHKTNALQIAAAADVATGTFYSYFNNKKEVFAEIIGRIFKRIFDKMLSIYEPKVHGNMADNYKEGRKMMSAMINQTFSEYKVNARLLKEIIALVMLDKEIEKIRREEEKKVIIFLVAFMQKYNQFLRVTDFEATAVLLLKIMEEMLHQVKFAANGIEEKRLRREVEDMICRYLLPGD